MESGRNLTVPISVPAQLRRPHPLVAELQAAAKGAQEDQGVLVLNYSKVPRALLTRSTMAYSVSPGCVMRSPSSTT